MIQSTNGMARMGSFIGKWAAERFPLFHLSEQASTYNHPRHFWGVVLFFCLVGGILRFYNLGTQGLWTDELYSLEIASRDLLGIWQITGLDLHPPVFYAMLSAILHLLPNNEANIRLLSALAGSLTILIWGIYLGRYHGPTTAIVGMLFLVVSPVQIFFSQEARSYATDSLWVVVSLFCVRWVERELSWRAWLAYSLTAILGIYLNYFLGLIVVGQLGWLFLKSKVWHCRRYLFFLALIILSSLPLLPNVNSAFHTRPVINLPDTGGRLLALPSAIESALIGDALYVPRFARWGTLGLFMLFGSLGILVLRKQSCLYFFTLAIPGIVVFVFLPLLGMQIPAYQEKQFFVLAPVMWILVSIGVAWFWMQRTWVAQSVSIIVCLGWFIMASSSLNQYWGGYIKSSEKQVVTWLVTNSTGNPILVVGPPGLGGALRYYAPSCSFLYLRKYYQRSVSLADTWITAQNFEMIPLNPSTEQCILENIQASQDFFLVEYIWLHPNASFAKLLKDLRVIEPITDIGNWRIYSVPLVPGGDQLCCKALETD